MLRFFNTLLAAAALCCFMSTAAQSQTLVADDFNVDGALVGSTPMPGPGGAWTNHSGSGSSLMVTGGQLVLTHGGGSREDANSAFAAQTAGLISYSFDFSVADNGAPITGADNEYFAHFGDGAFGFSGRLDLVAPTAAGDFTLGISTNTSTAQNTWGTDFSYGDLISVLVIYDITNNQAFLSVNGGTAIAGDLLGPRATSISNISFRQSNSANDETIFIDNLRVQVVPLPAAVWLMGSAVLGMAGLRRRKKI